MGVLPGRIARRGAVRAAPLVRVKAKFIGKNAVSLSLPFAAYGVFDCEFGLPPHEWSCSEAGAACASKHGNIRETVGRAVVGEHTQGSSPVSLPAHGPPTHPMQTRARVLRAATQSHDCHAPHGFQTRAAPKERQWKKTRIHERESWRVML